MWLFKKHCGKRMAIVLLQFKNFRKRVPIVIGILCVCVVAAILFFNSSAMKDNKTCRTAIKMIEQYKLDAAEEILDETSSSRAMALKKYITFRREIDSISFVNKVDVELVKKYKNDCEDIILLDEKLGSVIEKDLEKFVTNSELAIKTFEIYCDNRDIVSEMYDASQEEVRLCGNNSFSRGPYFTIAEEREKIANWKKLVPELDTLINELNSNYNSEIGSGIPRLIWLLDRTPKYISALEEDMNRASESYSEFEEIYYKEGSSAARYPEEYGNYFGDGPFLEVAEKELWALLTYRLDRPLEIISNQSSGKLKYVLLADRTVEITGVVSNEESYTIPEEVIIYGKIYKVSRIGEKAFYCNEDVEKVTLPETITHIAPNAFSKCGWGKEIKISAVPDYIALNAFDDSSFFICSPTKEIQDSLVDIFGYGNFDLNGEKMKLNRKGW